MGRRRATILHSAIAIGALLLGPFTIVAMVLAALGLSLGLLWFGKAAEERAEANAGTGGPETGRGAPVEASWWGWMVASLPAAVALHYALRGRYYWHSKMFLMVVLVAVASAAFYGLLRRPLRRAGSWGWLGTALGASAAALALVATFGPSAHAARGYVEAGQLAQARAELTELGSGEEMLPIWTELEAREALAAPSCEAVVPRLDALPERMRVAVRAHADALALKKARAAVVAGGWEEASLALLCGSEGLRAGVEARALERQIAQGRAGVRR